jgi:exonuclease I
VDDYLLQATKQGCAEFLAKTKVIGYRHQPFARFWTYPIKFLGINPTNQNEAICVDLNYPIEDVIDLSYQDIMGYLAKPNAESPFKIIRLNRSHGLADANAFNFMFDCPLAELNSNADRYDENPEWIERVLVASTDLEHKQWPKKEVIEQTIYEKFFSNADRNLFQKFHAAESLDEKLSLCTRFNDSRAKEFAHRILFQEDVSNLPKEIITFNKSLIKERWTSSGPWPCVETYLNEAEELKQERSSAADQLIICAVEDYLNNQQRGLQYG